MTGWLLTYGLLIPIVFIGIHALFKGSHLLVGRVTLSLYGLYLILLALPSVFRGALWQSGSGWVTLAQTGISFQPGLYLDGRNGPFVLLLGLVLPLVFLWMRDEQGSRPRSYWISANLLILSLFGVFTSTSLIGFYVFWEFALVGAYFWIGLHGKAGDRTPPVSSALLRFFLMTLLGSLPMLLSIAVICVQTGMDPGIHGLRTAVEGLSPFARKLAFYGFLIGFAVKLPLVGLHGWLRNVYLVSAPSCRAILSGLMSKMGAYGLIVILAPGFASEIAAHAGFLQALCVVGVLYGGLLCLGSVSFTELLAYSSLAHLNLLALGVFTAVKGDGGDSTALTGALFQAFNHGLIAAALFVFDARMTPDHRQLAIGDVGGLRQRQARLSGLLLLTVFASASLPGLSNFAGEVMVFYGAFRYSPWLTFFAATGALITAAAMLRAYHGLFLGSPRAQIPLASDLSLGDVLLGLLLAAIFIALGLYPMWFIAPVENALLGLGTLTGGLP